MTTESTDYQRANKLRIQALLGGKCKRCGFDDPRALQIDHVNSDGPDDIKGGGNAYYVRVRQFLADNPNQTRYQLLCANCNWIKRSESRENPRSWRNVLNVMRHAGWKLVTSLK